MLASTLFTLAGFVSFSTAGYVLKDDYNSKSFFSMFDFFTVGSSYTWFIKYHLTMHRVTIQRTDTSTMSMNRWP
jgi:hypothetical protein